MSDVQIKALIDWNGDGAFNHALSDVTANLIGANWQSGITTRSKRFPADGTAELEIERLDNFYPGAALLKPKRLVKIQLWNGTTWATMWTGYTKKFSFSTTAANAATIVVHCNQGLDEFFAFDRELPILQDVTVDEAISTVLDGGYWVPPGVGEVGRVGTLELGSGVVYGGSLAFNIKQTGILVFDYVGEGWSATNPQAIFKGVTELLQAERGWLFINRDGLVDVYNRYHLPIAPSVYALDLDTNVHNATLEYGANMANRVTIGYSTMEERSDVTFMDYPADISLARYQSKEIRFVVETDEGKRPRSVVAVDYGAMHDGLTITDAEGATLGKNTVRLLSGAINNSVVTITLVNLSKQPVIVSGLALVGTELKQTKSIFETADSPSIVALRQVITEKVDLPALVGEEAARAWASYELAERLGNLSEFTSVTVKFDDNAPLLQTVRPGVVVTISDSLNGLTALPHFVIGEQFRFSANDLEVTYTTAFAQHYGVGIVGVSKIGTETLLL